MLDAYLRLDVASAMARARVELGAKAVAGYRDGNNLLPHTATRDKTITRKIKMKRRRG